MIVSKRQGRPPLQNAERRRYNVALDVKDAELLEALAEKRLISLSEAIRQAVREAAAKEGLRRRL